MIVYVWERGTNTRVLVVKHVAKVNTLSKSFAIVCDDGEELFFDRSDYKLTIYSY